MTATMLNPSSPLDARSAQIQVDTVLTFLTAVRAAGEAVAGPAKLSKKARKVERRLINLWVDSWRKATVDAVADAASVLLSGSRKITEEELDAVLASTGQKLGPSFAASVLPETSEVLKASYALGRSLFDRSNKDVKAVKFNLVDQRAVDWLERDANYWVGSYYDRQLGEKIAASIKSTVLEQGLGRKAAGKALGAVFSGVALDEAVVGRKGYWEGVAAVAATRARTFGTVEGLVQAEIEQFEYVAVMDERTSDICRDLNGRIFRVSTAVAIRDSLLDASSPDDVKSITPWVSSTTAQGLSSANLEKRGVCLPPAHFRCRSTVVTSLVSDGTGVKLKTPSGASKRTKTAFSLLSTEELGNKLALLRVAPEQMEFDIAGRLAHTHGADPSQFDPVYTNTDAYRIGAWSLLQNSTNVFGRGDRRHGRIYHFVDVGQKTVTTATDSGKILAHVGYHHLSDAKWRKVTTRYQKTYVTISNLPTRKQAETAGFTSIHPEAAT